jgi:hypothetical protein
MPVFMRAQAEKVADARIDALIAANYPRAEVWAMTPRDIAASLYFADRRRRRVVAEQLALATLAIRGEPRALKKQMEDLQRD